MSGQCNTVEPAPYETPIQNPVSSSPSLQNETSFRPQDQSISPLYEELDGYAAPLAPSDYEVAVNQGTNKTSVDTYSSVENASQEAHNYKNTSEYTYLHPPNLDREQHIYTPPLQQSSSPRNDSQPDTQPQEVSSVTMEDTPDKSTTALSPKEQAHDYTSNHEHTWHPPNLDREQHIYTPPLQQSSSLQPQEQIYTLSKNKEKTVPSTDVNEKAQAQEHIYFTLDKIKEGGTVSEERMDAPF